MWTLKCWVLSKAASTTFFWVFGMIRPGIEPWSPRPLTNILLFRPMAQLKLSAIVEGNPKAPLSIATTPRCRRGATPYPGLLHFTLDPYLMVLSAKQGGIKYPFFSLWYDLTWDWTPASRTIGEHSNHYANGIKD